MEDFPGFTTLQILAAIQNMMTENLEQFPGRIIFMSMYNDIVWRAEVNEEICIANSQIVADHAKRFAHGIGLFLGMELKRSVTEQTYKPNGKWDRVA